MNRWQVKAAVGIIGLALGTAAGAAPAAEAGTPHPPSLASTAAAGTTTVPYVLFDPASLAISEIRSAGLVPVVRGQVRNSWVNTQSPLGGRVVTIGSTVTITTVTGPTP
jgi:hypothetical protein